MLCAQVLRNISSYCYNLIGKATKYGNNFDWKKLAALAQRVRKRWTKKAVVFCVSPTFSFLLLLLLATKSTASGEKGPFFIVLAKIPPHSISISKSEILFIYSIAGRCPNFPPFFYYAQRRETLQSFSPCSLNFSGGLFASSPSFPGGIFPLFSISEKAMERDLLVHLFLLREFCFFQPTTIDKKKGFSFLPVC